MADTKASAFTSTATAASTDVLPIVTGIGGTPANKIISVGNLGSQLTGIPESAVTNLTSDLAGKAAVNADTTGKSAKTDALNSATTVVNVAAATAPTSGQVLTATSPTAAHWATPSSGFSDPTTTKGDIITSAGAGAVRLSVGADGTVLTADSAQTDGIKWATPAAGGGSTPRVVLTDTLSAAGTVATDSTSGGSVSVIAGAGGMYLQRGTTATGGASVANPNGQYITPAFDKNPMVWFSMNDASFSASQTYQVYMTFDSAGAMGSTLPQTGKYFGFNLKNNNGTHELYSVHCDGTNAEVSTLLSSFAWGSNAHTLAAVMTSGTNIKFYCDGTLRATHTTNLPSGAQSGAALWKAIGVGSAGTSNQFMASIQAAGVSYDAF